ncbi:hypothetical protein LWI28_017232 [Acer negundo]|uniref:Uncharacterized protein n=1 Tax=Acer negundo TaxID=4023 RepID=A0AAD5IB07_ACENE|nr:hypothetical protein LWI28_017232 [Acer negundo]
MGGEDRATPRRELEVASLPSRHHLWLGEARPPPQHDNYVQTESSFQIITALWCRITLNPLLTPSAAHTLSDGECHTLAAAAPLPHLLFVASSQSLLLAAAAAPLPRPLFAASDDSLQILNI